MSEPKAKVYLGTLRELKSKDGKVYMAGRLGWNGLLMFQSKNDPTKWNLYVTEQESKEESDLRKSAWNKDKSGGGSFDGGIPF